MHDSNIWLRRARSAFSLFVYARVRLIHITFYFVIRYPKPNYRKRTYRIARNFRFWLKSKHTFRFVVYRSFLSFDHFSSLERFESHNKLTQFQSQHQELWLVAVVFAFANCNAIYVCAGHKTQLINDFSPHSLRVEKEIVHGVLLHFIDMSILTVTPIYFVFIFGKWWAQQCER